MKPAPFRYAAPGSLAEVLALKSEHGDDAKFLAGGQSLIPTMNFRLAQPAVLLDLNRLPDLNTVQEVDGGGLRIGALVRHGAVERDQTIARLQPVMAEAAACVAHPQIRNRGTLCGNLAHADPASEMPAVLLALGARMHAASAGSDRWIDAGDFFEGVFTTALGEDEMLLEVEVPAAAARSGACFLEVSRRPGDFAMMGVVAVVALDDSGHCAQARLAYCGAGETPLLATATASALTGSGIDDEAIREAGMLAAGEIDPAGNVHVTGAYQKQLVQVLTARALGSATARARENREQAG